MCMCVRVQVLVCKECVEEGASLDFQRPPCARNNNQCTNTLGNLNRPKDSAGGRPTSDAYATSQQITHIKQKSHLGSRSRSF